MKEFHVSQLPVINGPLYKGLISEDDLIDLDDTDIKVADFQFSAGRPFVMADEHIFDVIKKISENNLTVLPVLGEAEAYIGVISLESLVRNFANMSAIRNPGAIIMLEMAQSDYALSEIARIVESNDGVILNLTVNHSSDTNKMQVIIKINKQEISQVIASFERYDYNVVQTYQESVFEDMLKDRYDALMNYLDI